MARMGSARAAIVAIAAFLFFAAGGRAEGQTRLLLMDLETPATTADEARLIDGMLSVEIAKQSPFLVVSARDMARMLALEAAKETSGCESGKDCMAELAGAFGARFVVYGQLGKLGKLSVVNLFLHDQENEAIIARETLRVASVEGLPDAVQQAIPRLLSPALKAVGLTAPSGAAPAVVNRAETVVQAPTFTRTPDDREGRADPAVPAPSLTRETPSEQPRAGEPAAEDTVASALPEPDEVDEDVEDDGGPNWCFLGCGAVACVGCTGGVLGMLGALSRGGSNL